MSKYTCKIKHSSGNLGLCIHNADKYYQIALFEDCSHWQCMTVPVSRQPHQHVRYPICRILLIWEVFLFLLLSQGLFSTEGFGYGILKSSTYKYPRFGQILEMGL